MNEPKWLKNPMTGECPVPDGHKADIILRNGKLISSNEVSAYFWTHAGELSVEAYRDWTEFYRQQEKPNLSYEASYNRLDKLSNMQAKRLNEMESDFTREIIKTMRELEVMINRLSKDGDAMTLQLALNSKNRLNSYLYEINK